MVLKRLKVMARAASVQKRFGDRPLTVDPALGDAFATRLIGLARGGDVRALADLTKTIDHPDDHAFYVRIVAGNPGVETWVDEWVAAEPRSAFPLCVKGWWAIEWAWEARGNGRAKTVSRDAFALFFERLALAEDCLTEAAGREPDNATPWGYKVLLGRARQVGLGETRRRYEEATRRYPWHWEAHNHMLQQVCPKWGGSYELMHEFAEAAVAAMPAGSALGHLVAMAHIEHWLEAEDGMDHLTSPETRASLRAAAEKSILRPDFERRAGWPRVPNGFAMAWALNEDHEAAAAAFDLAGDHVTEAPWSYLSGQPAENYANFRARAHLLR